MCWYWQSLWLTCGTLCRKQALMTRSEAARDGVSVPTSLKEYCIATKPPRPQDSVADLDFYDDDYLDDDDDEDENDDDGVYDNDEDSGNSDT